MLPNTCMCLLWRFITPKEQLRHVTLNIYTVEIKSRRTDFIPNSQSIMRYMRFSRQQGPPTRWYPATILHGVTTYRTSTLTQFINSFRFPPPHTPTKTICSLYSGRGITNNFLLVHCAAVCCSMFNVTYFSRPNTKFLIKLTPYNFLQLGDFHESWSFEQSHLTCF
jgi:hypothetical protein